MRILDASQIIKIWSKFCVKWYVIFQSNMVCVCVPDQNSIRCIRFCVKDGVCYYLIEITIHIICDSLLKMYVSLCLIRMRFSKVSLICEYMYRCDLKDSVPSQKI